MTSDLVALVPDKDIEQAVEGLLSMHKRLGIRPLRHKMLVHPRRDPGVYHEAAEMLRGYAGQARHAVVVLDHAWEGVPYESAELVEAHLDRSLATVWGDRATAVCIAPEVEAWIWSDSPHVAEELGWKGEEGALRDYVDARGWWTPGATKPGEPKLAFEAALREKRVPNSSSIFRRLATRVSLQRCEDRAFVRLRSALARWFALSQE